MSTIARGNTAEAAVILRLEGFDIAALLPSGRLAKVQVKCGRARHGCVSFNTHATDHGRGPLHYRGRADLFGIYARSIDRVFMVPVADVGRNEGRLRLDPTRNNQRIGVRFAEDYAFERWAEALP